MTERNMNRRDFLKWTGMAGAGLALAACAPSSAPAAPERARGEAAPSQAATPVLFWFQAENHKPEYEGVSMS